MPELPEVEIVRKSLNKKISGKIINDVRVKNLLFFGFIF